MKEQSEIDYQRIEKAIYFLRDNFRHQPTLEEIAEKVHMSPFHFQRVFQEWAGISPKKFTQFLTIQYAKSLLSSQSFSVSEATGEVGLSSSSRLFELFVDLEAMTPSEYKSGGKNLSIHYSFHSTLFGGVIVASTLKGDCYLAFMETKEESFLKLQQCFPLATYRLEEIPLHIQAVSFFNNDLQSAGKLKLHLKGSEFQLKVWAALLQIPSGQLTTYSAIAEMISSPSATRAVGTAIGSNPVAYIIPCHRVIRATGELGGYMWGLPKKTAMIGWEASRKTYISKE